MVNRYGHQEYNDTIKKGTTSSGAVTPFDLDGGMVDVVLRFQACMNTVQHLLPVAVLADPGV